MGAIQIIDELSRHGASVFLDGAEVKIGLTQEVPNGLMVAAKQYKSELINLLRGESGQAAICDSQKKTPVELENFTECVAERSAIMQESAGLSEQEAEEQVNVICMSEWKRWRQ